MRVWTWISKDYKDIKANLIKILGTFILVPILLGLMYGVLFNSILDKSVKVNDIKVYIDASNYNQNNDKIIKILQTMDFISVESTNEVLDTLLKEETHNLGVIVNEKDISVINYGQASLEKSIVLGLINDIGSVVVSDEFNKLPQKEQELKLNEIINANMTQYTITEEVSSKDKLNPYGIMLVSVFSAMSVFIAMESASKFIKSRQNTLIDRLISIDIPIKSIFIDSSVSVLVFSFIAVILYSVLSYGVILRMNILKPNLLVVLAIQALFITSVYSFSIGVFRREKVYKNTVITIAMVFMLVGGSFFPVDGFSNLATLPKYMPNYNIILITRRVLLGSSLSELVRPMAIILIESLIFFIIGIVTFGRDKRRCINA